MNRTMWTIIGVVVVLAAIVVTAMVTGGQPRKLPAELVLTEWALQESDRLRSQVFDLRLENDRLRVRLSALEGLPEPVVVVDTFEVEVIMVSAYPQCCPITIRIVGAYIGHEPVKKLSHNSD